MVMKVKMISFLLIIGLCGCSFGAGTSVKVVERPDAGLKNDYYIGNRPPLLPSPFMKLPIGSITPDGWLRKQLELQKTGFHGHLDEISGFLRKEGNAWLSPKGEGHSPWEELPYWLKGFGDSGYVLNDKRIIDEARVWLENTFASQREDGYFGPRVSLTSLRGNPDLWANMVMLTALQSYYEYSGDKRVIELMTQYFRWEMTIPDPNFLEPYWQNQRGGDNLASVYWLYNITGDKSLLNLAEKIYRNTANWTDDVPDWHNVNIAQAFDTPGIYYMQSKDPKHLAAVERNWQKVRDLYGQVPGGMYGSDENCRPGYTGPRQAVETCGMAEEMASDQTLLRITGDAKWADQCENVAFNSLPAAFTPDYKALRYLTAPNLPLSDKRSKSPGVQNGGPMFLYDPYDHRCCQHNWAQAWPYLAENLWMATPGNGLAAIFYSSSKVKAKVGDGTEVTISEQTKYPFDETIEFIVSAPNKVAFPLYLRIPGWCDNPQLKINSEQMTFQSKPSSYLVIERTWSDGDKINLTLPMKIQTKTWTKNFNSISVNRGPLTYSLKIGEKYVKEGNRDKWPAWELYPTTAWNYGLVLNSQQPEKSFEFIRKDWPSSGQPFEANDVPVQLKAKARKIPEWTLDRNGLIKEIQPSPVLSNEPEETVTLIPMGAARLRISAFPVIGKGPDANKWQAPQQAAKTIPSKASHCFSGDTIDALSDNLLPKNSGDQSIPRMTFWDQLGTKEWVQYDFEKSRKIQSVEVYWFDDTGAGQCRVPASWQAVYKDGESWKPVKVVSGSYGVEKDKFNIAAFEPVETSSMRLEIQLQPNVSGGILEWRVK